MTATHEVQPGEAGYQQQVHEALVEIGDQPAEQLRAKEEPASGVDELVDAPALGAGHAEDLGLLGDPHRLADPAGVAHLRLG